jgi:hypothetical protein
MTGGRAGDGFADLGNRIAVGPDFNLLSRLLLLVLSAESRERSGSEALKTLHGRW